MNEKELSELRAMTLDRLQKAIESEGAEIALRLIERQFCAKGSAYYVINDYLNDKGL